MILWTGGRLLKWVIRTLQSETHSEAYAFIHANSQKQIYLCLRRFEIQKWRKRNCHFKNTMNSLIIFK